VKNAEYDMRLGARVRSLRTSRGVRLKTLALVLGVSRQQVWSYERGRTRMSAATVAAIAAALDVTAGAILEEEKQT